MFASLFFRILCLIFIISSSQSNQLLPQSINEPSVMALESINIFQLPQKFRSTQNLSKLDETKISKKGLAHLNISGSAQFSDLELKALLKNLPPHAYVVDLRQESHGFVNALPFIWASYHNWENRYLDLDQIIQKEARRLENLRSQDQFEGITYYPKGSSFFEQSQLITFPIVKIENEKEVVLRNKAQYQRFYVADHTFPSNQIIDDFLNFVSTLPKESWLHFHCRAGHGRTTTFMVLYDILKNGRDVSLFDIIERQKQLGGINLQVINLKTVHKWAVVEAQNRINKIKDFYRYINDPQGFGQQSWSNWVSQNL